MKKQTAVEWLEIQLKKGIDYNPLDLSGYTKAVDNLFNQAKAMEKEQIKNAWVNAWQESFIEPLDYQFYEPEAEQYYNETYGN